jgi:hypothetical protein
MEERPDPIFYLCQSERCSRLAKEMPDPFYHRQMLEIADTYKRLASQLNILQTYVRQIGGRTPPH